MSDSSNVFNMMQVSVEAPPKGGKPTGKVTFWSDGLAVSPALDLVDGQAAYNYTGFMVGSHSVFATYSGGGACPLGVSASILRQVGTPLSPLSLCLPLFLFSRLRALWQKLVMVSEDAKALQGNEDSC